MVTATPAKAAEVEAGNTVEAVSRQEELQRNLVDVQKMLDGGLEDLNKELMLKQQAKLQRELNGLSKRERTAIEEAAQESLPEDVSVRIKVVTQEAYNQALTAKVTDERAKVLMEAAEDLGVELEPGEIVMIRKASAVDQGLSESLTKDFAEQLKGIPGSVILAQRGSGGGGGGGPRGDIPWEVGTKLVRKHKDRTHEAEVIQQNGSKAIKLGDQVFDSVSGAARSITGYNTRGTTWWAEKKQN